MPIIVGVITITCQHCDFECKYETEGPFNDPLSPFIIASSHCDAMHVDLDKPRARISLVPIHPPKISYVSRSRLGDSGV